MILLFKGSSNVQVTKLTDWHFKARHFRKKNFFTNNHDKINCNHLEALKYAGYILRIQNTQKI